MFPAGFRGFVDPRIKSGGDEMDNVERFIMIGSCASHLRDPGPRRRQTITAAGRDQTGRAGAAQRPATVMPSILSVGASMPKRNSRSLAGVRCANMSLRLPATVSSLTGKASAPCSIQNPEAPRL